MPRHLEAAYRAADYLVEAPGGSFVLHVDEPGSALAELHRQHHVAQSAFITACNPRSVPHSGADNDAAHTRLLALLRGAGHVYIEGWGRDPGAAWPAERSVLVPGLSLAAALELARRFGQSAILHAGADAVPRLVWVR